MARLSGSKIDEFCTQGKSIWVKNKTGAILLIDMAGPGGANVSLRIQPGSNPFCVSDYVTPEMIKGSPVLRRLISEGHLDLMDPEDPILEKAVSSKPMKSVVDASGTPEELREKQLTPRKDVPIALDPELEDLEASPTVAFWCDSVDKGDMRESDFLDKVKSTEDTLTEDDLSHIIQSLKGRKEIIDWATNLLASKREGEAPDEDSELDVSSGSDEELNRSAKELIARSQPRGNSNSGKVKVEHNTLSKSERQELQDRLNK